jgi:enoyl-[acyl-carrier protein] reductase III
MFETRPQRSMVGDRFLTDRDVADAVLFLASPLSDLVQGQILIVDGGEGIHP